MSWRDGAARRRRCPAIPVLMFHGVCQRIPEYVLFPGGRTCLLGVEHFRAVIGWCRRRFDLITLSDLDDRLLAESGRYRPLLLTFDDGLASAIDHAVPVLKEHGASAVMFVAPRWTDGACTPDVFHLERIAFDRIPTALRVEVAGRSFQAAVRSPRQGRRAFAALWRFLLAIGVPPLRLRLADVTLDGRPVERGQAPESRDFWFPATWNELRAAVRQGVLEIGSHGLSHVPLSWLAEEEAHAELAGSRARLEQEFGGSVTACAYPHGLCSPGAARIAARSYRWAFSSRAGLLRPEGERWLAPRIHVPGEDWRVMTRTVTGLVSVRARLRAAPRALARLTVRRLSAFLPRPG